MPRALTSPSPGGSGAGSHQSIQKTSIWEPACPSDGLTAPCAQDTDKTCHRSGKNPPGLSYPPRPRRCTHSSCSSSGQTPAGGGERGARTGSAVNKTTTKAPNSFPGYPASPQQSWKHKRAPLGIAAGHSHAFPCCGRTGDAGCRGLVVPQEPHAGASPATWLARSCGHSRVLASPSHGCF